MRAFLLAALACATALAGCVSAPGPGCPAQDAAKVTPGESPVTVDPRLPSDLLYVVEGLEASAPPLDIRVTTGRAGAEVALERVEFNSSLPGQRLGRLRASPTDLAQGIELRWQAARDLPAGCAPAGGLVHNVGSIPMEGEVLRPGQGTHVWYAGFWENGTLFETNIEAFDRSAWPRAGWYESVPYEPLPVYVYNQSWTEEPAHWRPLPRAPATATPVDGPAGTAAAAPGVGYYPTIKGFNDGLKGLSTTSSRVIWMEAKDAYPAGAADNPLAGANLVFYVRLADVVDAPCPSPAMVGETPCPSAP